MINTKNVAMIMRNNHFLSVAGSYFFSANNKRNFYLF